MAEKNIRKRRCVHNSMQPEFTPWDSIFPDAKKNGLDESSQCDTELKEQHLRQQKANKVFKSYIRK